MNDEPLTDEEKEALMNDARPMQEFNVEGAHMILGLVWDRELTEREREYLGQMEWW